MTIIQKAQFAGRLEIKSSTTDGSASVEVSPMLSISLPAIFRKIRRIIYPERVFGSPRAHFTTSKAAIIALISAVVKYISSPVSESNKSGFVYVFSS